MELLLPQGAGPPPHHHEWDEAYYIADGEVNVMPQDGAKVPQIGQRHGIHFLPLPGGRGQG